MQVQTAGGPGALLGCVLLLALLAGLDQKLAAVISMLRLIKSGMQGHLLPPAIELVERLERLCVAYRRAHAYSSLPAARQKHWAYRVGLVAAALDVAAAEREYGDALWSLGDQSGLIPGSSRALIELKTFIREAEEKIAAIEARMMPGSRSKPRRPTLVEADRRLEAAAQKFGERIAKAGEEGAQGLDRVEKALDQAAGSAPGPAGQHPPDASG